MNVPLVERITLRHVSPDFAFATVRLADVHLNGIKIKKSADGTLQMTMPTEKGRDGREWPVFALQPHAREAVEAAIREIWERSSL